MAPPTGTSRALKIGEEIRRALAEIFMRGETHIPVLDSSSITVSEVRVSPDMHNANVYVMPLAGEHKQEVMDALGEHAGHIRHLIANKVALRYMPKLHYKLDTSFEEAARMNALLQQPDVRRDTAKKE